MLPPSSDHGPPKHEAIAHKQDQHISTATAELSGGQLNSTHKTADLIVLLLISHRTAIHNKMHKQFFA
jgi:hypothetical protein